MRLPFVALPVLLMALTGCGQPPAAPASTTSPPPTAAQSQAKIDEFFASFTDQWVEGNPNQAVAVGYFSGDKQDQLARQLTPLSREFQLKRHALAREGLARLAQLDLSQATPVQQRAAQLFKWQLETNLEAEPFLEIFDYPLNQMDGAAVSLANALAVVQPVNNAHDADNYVARLQQVDERMQEAIAESASMAEHGSVMPAFIVRTAIAQLQQFISAAPKDNPLVTTLASKTAKLADLPAEQRTALLQQAEQIVTNEVYPAWQAAIAELTRELPLATDDAGLWRFANGAQIYQQRLRASTSTDYTAEQIHAMGLREVARLEAEMDVLFKQIGFTKGSILQRKQQLQAKTAYSHDDAGRAAMSKDIEGILTDALKRSALLFDVMPKTPVISQAYPQFRWDTAAATYTAAPQDGSRPAIFQFPLRNNELSHYDKRSLVYHETVPGHHFQLALMAENKELPRFVQVRAYGANNAVIEGWALYAERLADESGWYEGDIESRLGYLDSQLFRARRLVVDTGIHAMHWTRQQAIDYGIVPSEVERYVVWPGQATSYMVGMLKILELREKTKTALGDKFALKEFHNVVLGAGTVPFTMMEQIVDEYIASKK